MTRFFSDLLATIADRGRALVDRSGADVITGNDAAASAEVILADESEVTGITRAHDLLSSYRMMDDDERATFFAHLATDFGPDLDEVKNAITSFNADPSAATAARLHNVTEPRRQDLIRRLNQAPGGTAALVDMRTDLLAHIPDNPNLEAVDTDFNHLLASWFNRGFLVLEDISWETPANILEKIIRYEAVHEIRSWDDLRRRIEPADRRCFAFFHPAMVDEPLIFVEVALTSTIPDAIAPILSEDRTVTEPTEATTAVFYSISNCQTGLKGVSFGNFLIKQVVEELLKEFPHLKTFVTLSPAPTFARWLKTYRQDPSSGLTQADQQTLDTLVTPEWAATPEEAETLKPLMMSLASTYYMQAKHRSGKPFDPVARFHLGNGARLERINWMGDVSDNGHAQSHGFMVNYLYDLKHIEKNHEAYANRDEVAAASSIRRSVRPLAKAA